MQFPLCHEGQNPTTKSARMQLLGKPSNKLLVLSTMYRPIQSSQVTNHGCTLRPVDPHFEQFEPFDFGYIADTVYPLAESDDSLGPLVRDALSVIEKAFQDYG